MRTQVKMSHTSYHSYGKILRERIFESFIGPLAGRLVIAPGTREVPLAAKWQFRLPFVGWATPWGFDSIGRPQFTISEEVAAEGGGNGLYAPSWLHGD